MTTLLDVQDFLALHRLAVVGVSRNPKDFTRLLFREFLNRGYDAVPVNPGIREMEGVACFASLSDVAPPVEGALLLTPPEVTEQVVEECAAAGVRRVWMYRAAGRGAVSLSAAVFCAANGIRVVKGECPFMFLPEAPWIHRAHGMCRKLVGRYPQ
ncbi:MAG: CoA-binding protein [Bryobacteraceae bacterium]